MADQKQERRQQILIAALEAFSAKGYDKTSMDEIVQVSGLSKGTLYWYFKSKNEIFAAIIAMTAEQFVGLSDDMFEVAQELSPPDALRMLLSRMAAQVEQNPRFAALTIDFFLQAWHDTDLRKFFSDLYVKYIDAVTPVIQRGIDEGYFEPVEARVAAATIAGMIDGILAQTLFEGAIAGEDNTQWSMRSVFNMAAQIIVNGLRKRDSDLA